MGDAFRRVPQTPFRHGAHAGILLKPHGRRFAFMRAELRAHKRSKVHEACLRARKHAS